jgi:short-subunit dehydrogenase
MNTIAIVGAGKGISGSVAKRFGSEGFQIALIARNAEKLEGLKTELEGQGFTVRTYTADAGDAKTLSASLERVTADLGAPQVLVYNAMSSSVQGAVSLEPAALEADFRVNVSGALVAAKAVLPAMLEANRGTILFTGGGLALHPAPQYASLAVGKAGLRNLAFSLAQELEPKNIHVATVTVAGFVKPGTAFDPDKIAAHYWRLHTQARGAWETEHLFQGEP